MSVSDVTICAVVKCNAYGHGVEECAPALQQAGASWFGVTSTDEGIVLRESGITGAHSGDVRLVSRRGRRGAAPFADAGGLSSGAGGSAGARCCAARTHRNAFRSI